MSLNSPPRIIRQAPPKVSPLGPDEYRGSAPAGRPWQRRLFERPRLPPHGELVHKPVPKPAARKRKRGNNNSASKKKPKKGGRRKKRTRRRRSRRKRRGGQKSFTSGASSVSWEPNTTRSKCPIQGCGSPTFVPFVNKKHHCRRCGRVVCNNCSEGRVSLDALKKEGRFSLHPNGRDSGSVRICDECILDRENNLLSTDEQIEFIDKNWPEESMGFANRIKRKKKREAIMSKRNTPKKKGWFSGGRRTRRRRNRRKKRTRRRRRR